MRHELHTTVTIPAPPNAVWQHLVDFGAYTEWNPFLTRIDGEATEGSRLSVRLEPPGGRPMTFRPRVTEVVPSETLEWLGRPGIPGVFDGRHRFDLTATDQGTMVVHGEVFSGLLVPVLRRWLDGATRAGFEAMNRALAERVAG